MERTRDYRTEIKQIRSAYLSGDMTLDEAQALVEPLLQDMNARGAAIAKEYGRRFKKLTFGYVFR